MCVCVCLLFANQSGFRHQEQKKRWERERECLWEKKFGHGKLTTALGLWTESDLYSFLSASASRRPSNTCTGEEEVERAQDYSSQMGDLVARFNRLETRTHCECPRLFFQNLEESPSDLYCCTKAKVRTCMATESKRIPGLVMAKLCLSTSSCMLLFPSFVWRVASNGRFSVNGCRKRTDPE